MAEKILRGVFKAEQIIFLDTGELFGQKRLFFSIIFWLNLTLSFSPSQGYNFNISFTCGYINRNRDLYTKFKYKETSVVSFLR